MVGWLVGFEDAAIGRKAPAMDRQAECTYVLVSLGLCIFIVYCMAVMSAQGSTSI